MNSEYKPDMAQIPYIEHELRMAKAYEREEKLKEKNAYLKRLFVGINIFWGCVVAIGVVCSVVR
jgi:hypothetical protein